MAEKKVANTQQETEKKLNNSGNKRSKKTKKKD